MRLCNSAPVSRNFWSSSCFIHIRLCHITCTMVDAIFKTAIWHKYSHRDWYSHNFGILTWYSESPQNLWPDDIWSCYEHGLSTAKDALNHGPTGTHRSHGHMWSNPDQEDVPRPGVMAHHKMASLLPFLHRSAAHFSSFFNQITKKASIGPCRDSPSLLPGNPPQGDDSWRSDGLGAVHQEHWPMAIHSRW